MSARDEGTEDVVVDADPVDLPGLLTVPEEVRGLVVFAHGSGSSRHSTRNQQVAGVLHEAALATLLFDLLTSREEQDRHNVFDVGLLGDRLAKAVRWARGDPRLARLPVGLFGASTGAAAALSAAAMEPDVVSAVVSRGGRPDLAGELLAGVDAPTLLIVGGRDETVLDLNRGAQARLRCSNRLQVVPGATHLFEEPGALATVADAAKDWFVDHLGHADPTSRVGGQG